MYFVALFSVAFFYKLQIKNSKEKGGHLGYYEDEIKDSDTNFCKFSTIIAFNVGFAFCLSIPFTLIETCIKILFFLISLPFKLYPLKLFFGIMLQGLRGSL